ncbi:MAG: CooT family nickel-binding protein [Spirochaetota bacterium]
MCMPTVWIKNNSKEEQIFANTATLRIDDNNIVLSSLFEEEKVIKAVIEKIDFINSRVILIKTN